MHPWYVKLSTFIYSITEFHIGIFKSNSIWKWCLIFQFQNGTWYHLDVHAKPHFVQKPDDIVYVSIRDQVILVCQVRKKYIFFEPMKLVDIRFALYDIHPYICSSKKTQTCKVCSKYITGSRHVVWMDMVDIPKGCFILFICI